MRSVDTNTIVRLIARDDLKQAAAAERFLENGAWVSHLVLAETMWVLRAVYDRTPAELATAVTMLLDHEQLTFQDPDVVSAALESFRSKPSIGFSDCLILEIARKAGHLPLGTFDRSFAKLEGAERIDARI
jgi:predicted nucleic-acid-binding protein